MKNYFSRRPPKGYKPPEILGFQDFSSAHDPREYRKQREALDGGRLDTGYDDSTAQTVKGIKDGNKQ